MKQNRLLDDGQQTHSKRTVDVQDSLQDWEGNACRICGTKKELQDRISDLVDTLRETDSIGGFELDYEQAEHEILSLLQQQRQELIEKVEEWFKECMVIQQTNYGKSKVYAEAFAKGSWNAAKGRLIALLEGI